METKAKAMSMLLCGDSPRYVAAQCHVDRRTARAWRDEAFDLMADSPLVTLRRDWRARYGDTLAIRGERLGMPQER